jgi:hypothetical protein
MIYFWNDKQLARDLKNNLVSEKHKFIYFMIYMLLPILARLNQINILGLTYTLGFILGIFAAIAIWAWVFYFFYKTNKNGDGKNFIERYICLAFPLSVRCYIFSIPAFLLIFFYPQTAILVFIFFICMIAWLFDRMYTLFRIASGQMD